MSTVQKLIKYAAIALAVLIIASMISLGVSILSAVVGVIEDDDAPESIKAYDFNASEISSLYIDLDAASLEIKRGDTLTVTADENHVEVKQSGNTLKIKENTIRHRELSIVLTLPEMSFSSVELDMDAGVLRIDSLTTETLKLELDAGDASADYLCATKKAEISGGAGKFVVRDGTLTSLDLDVSAGKCEIRSRLSKNATIDCDIGSIDLSLIGTKAEYKFDVSSDLGSVNIDGSSVTDGTVGEGESTVTLDCDIGSVNITTGS